MVLGTLGGTGMGALGALNHWVKLTMVLGALEEAEMVVVDPMGGVTKVRGALSGVTGSTERGYWEHWP